MLSNILVNIGLLKEWSVFVTRIWKILYEKYTGEKIIGSRKTIYKVVVVVYKKKYEGSYNENDSMSGKKSESQ